MTKDIRALDKSEVLNFVNNSNGVSGSTLNKIFGNKSALYAMLDGFVKADFIQKKKLSRENIYYSKTYDLSKVFELDNISKALVKLHEDFKFRFSGVSISNVEDKQEVFLNTVVMDKQLGNFYNYKFSLTNIDFNNIESYQTKDKNYLDILVINDYELVLKIKDKIENNELGQKMREGQVRKDIIIYDTTTQCIYSFVINQNSKEIQVFNTFEDFVKVFKGRVLSNVIETKHYLRLYTLKKRNIEKYSKKQEGGLNV